MVKNIRTAVPSRNWGWRITGKRDEGTFEDDGNILSLRDLGYTGECICQNSSSNIFKIWHFTV